jgi:hypothetical protein
MTTRAVVAMGVLSAAVAACSGEAIPLVTAGRSPVTPGAPPPAGDKPAVPMAVPAACESAAVPPAPLRRLTRFEYDNTVRDLLGDTTGPAGGLPAEELGNGFGNDASAQAVSSLLAEQYGTVAEGVAARATASPAALGRLAPCAAAVSAAGEEGCARTIIEGLAPRAYRRPLAAGESDELLGLFRATRPGATFASAVAAVLEAVLQSPEFLYRIERGAAGKPTGDELATRLSYFLWGTMPDDPLRAAARNGELASAAGVLAQAKRMLADPRAHAMVRFFFDNLLPINGLSDLERDKTLYPTYTPAMGSLMQEETQRLLEHEIFEGSGTWPAALTAPYTYLNGALARFYGVAGVSGQAFRQVPLDTTQRLGFLTHAGVMAGTTHSNQTNPVVRGSFVVQKLLCQKIPLPDASIAAKVKPPDPYSGKTGRERFTNHQQDPVCATCHSLMDPVGFALENFDPVGLFRTEENGVPIDASGGLPGTPGTIDGPVALARALAASEGAEQCLATHWLELAHGKTLGGEDQCLLASVNAAFAQSGHDVRALLLALTQTDAFLTYPGSP